MAPLVPALLKLLNGEGGHVPLRAIAQLGQEYVTRMRSRVPTGQSPTRIVDKMLRNAWNVGYIAIMMPKVTHRWRLQCSMIPLSVVTLVFRAKLL